MKYFAILLALLAAPTLAQPVPEPIAEPKPPGVIGAPAGTGAFPAIAEALADAPGYTFYRPAKLPKAKLPLVLWGNGGCMDNGLSASHFLREVASHGYIIVANGAPRSERAVVDRVDPDTGPPPPPAGTPMSPPRNAPDQTTTTQLLAAIEWAERATADKASRWHRRIDTRRIAVMGHSCGGLQALSAGADARIAAVVAFNSGVFVRADRVLRGVNIVKDDLKKLHTPVAYFQGGPTDIAYNNGADDVKQIGHVPVFHANLGVGHGGTFRLANGGDWARYGTAWLDWQLKRNRKAARWFVGKACGLCTASGWTIERKQFPEKP